MSSYPNIKTQYQAFVSTPDLFVDDAVTGYPPFVTSPISLPNHISASQKVFGKRAEEYLASYITQHPDYAPLVHGLQIIDHKITIGELDFLLYDKVDKTTKHIELVSKLYVYDPSFTKEMDRWIGPNRKDSLAQKVEKLTTKQFPLLYADATKTALKNHEIGVISIQQELCFKAHLFIPYQYHIQQLRPIVNLNCIVGFWLHRQQLSLPEFQSFSYCLPEKPDWYCPPNHKANWLSLAEAQPQIAEHHQRQKSPLVWINNGNNSFDRCFVVWW